MKISLVTVSFNQRDYLREAIDSVLDQGYSELEYIVVDPGSTDGSRELIQSYSDQISHILFEPDKGAADGLNKGFSLATGDVFGFLNSDDLLLPGSLQRVADFFQQHPECDIAFGNGRIVNGKGEQLRHVKARDVTVRRFFCGGSRWLQQSTFFRREAFLRSPKFNIENRTCWDGELFVNLVNQGAVAGYIGEDLAGFRIHRSSISGTGRMLQVFREDFSRIFRDIQRRNWSLRDDLWQFLYRSEGALYRLGSLIGKPGKGERS